MSPARYVPRGQSSHIPSLWIVRDACRFSVNSCLIEGRDASADRLRSMVTKALDRIEHEIEDGPDGAKIALKVIELANASTIGPTTTQDVAASIGKRHECTAGLRVLDVVRGMSRLDEEGDAVDDAETAPNDRTAAYGESRCR